MSNLEFIEEPHIYLYKGIQIPCVSDIIKYRFPDMYANVPKNILDQKANYGTQLHQIIESYIKGEITLKQVKLKRIDPNIKASVEQFEKLQNKWMFYYDSVEQHVHYKNIYAGTYDLLTKDKYLIDIKTTQKLHLDNETLEAPLNLQLSLYYLALGVEKEKGYCLWLPKGEPGAVKEVNCWPKERILELLKKYEQENKSHVN